MAQRIVSRGGRVGGGAAQRVLHVLQGVSGTAHHLSIFRSILKRMARRVFDVVARPKDNVKYLHGNSKL